MTSEVSEAADFDLVLPLLVPSVPKPLNNDFRVSEICDEYLLRKGTALSQGTVAQTLREAVVLTLTKGSGFKVDEVNGEVIYLLPGPDVKGNIETALRQKSRKELLKFIWRQRIIPVCFASLKIFVGVFLVFSLFVLALALIALLAASKQRQSGDSNFFMASRSHHGRSWWCPMRVWFWPWPVQAGGAGAGAGAVVINQRTGSGGMSFIEAIFSFIFGDGPDELREEAQLRTLRVFISSKEGRRIKAVEFTPFLLEPMNLPNESAAVEQPLPDEAFMATIVSVFHGNIVASDDGKLSYEFPRIKSNIDRTRELKCFRERKLIFSFATPEQQKLALGLGIANIVCLLLVAVQLSDNGRLQVARLNNGMLIRGALDATVYLFPFLGLYAIVFLAIPLARYLYIEKVNQGVDRRNDLRERWSRKVTGQSFV